MSERRLAAIVAGSVPLAWFVGSLAPTGEVGLVVIVAVFAWASRQVSGFGRSLLRGAAAGAVAGTLVLGPGLRLAMRLVAVADPDRQPEFTLDGTAFIVIVVGLVFGVMAGMYLIAVGQLLELRRVPMAIVAVVALLLILFGDSELRSELIELGFGAWVNIPLFASVAFAYGWAVDLVADRLEHRSAGRRSMEPIGVS